MKQFSESKNSMIQSAMHEYLTQKATRDTQAAAIAAPKHRGLVGAMPTMAPSGQPDAAEAAAPAQLTTPQEQEQHDQMQALNAVLETASSIRQRAAPHASFLANTVTQVEGFFHRIAEKFTHSDAVEAFGILEEYVAALLAGNTALAQQKAAELKKTKYSDTDPNWAQSMITWFNTYKIEMKKPQYTAYQSLDDFSYPLPATPNKTLRVGLIGDWGTGEASAVKVLQELFALKPDIIIHLGDIYYSGTRHEYDAKYHAIIEKARQDSGQNVPVYNLPGNHDYYSGGQGFYEALSRVNAHVPGFPQQQASYLALFNNSWQLQGMDTGFHDNNVLEVNRDTTFLNPSEVTWQQHQLDKAVAAGRKVILLSHHQLFSRYEAIDDKTYNDQLLGNFKSYIDKKQVSAWFWGHEHVAAIYKPTLGLAKGRCIGNSAVPVFFNDGAAYTALKLLKGEPVTNLPDVEYDPSKFTHDDKFYNQGYALLELKDDKTGTASYYTIADSTPYYTEPLG